MFRRILFLILILFFPLKAGAQPLSLIEDEETESVLISYLVPLFKAANLNSDEIKIHLVKDDSMNAFATKGAHIFIHTGLLTKAEDAQEIIAVLAHETGHIAGGHIVRLYDQMRIAQRNILISMLLATVAGVASGKSEVGVATMMGAQTSAQNLLMGYRRTEENAADQTAVSLLSETGHGLIGFEKIMKKLQAQENFQIDPKNDVLWRTHPDIKERLSFILSNKKNVLPENKNRITAENEAFKRIQAKLFAFLASPEKTKGRYPETNNDFHAVYARAIAEYRLNNIQKAIDLLNRLIKKEPKNPYLYELKGQILFETGQTEKSVESYAKAVELSPYSALLRIGLAQAQTAGENRNHLLNALDNLHIAGEQMPDSAFVWRLMAVAYGKLEMYPMAHYALAEYNLKRNDFKQAVFFAEKALKTLPESAVAFIKTQDILNQAELNLQKTKM